MNSGTEPITYTINKLYDETSYMERYGLDVWITVFIVGLVFFAIGYFYIQNKLKPIKADWDNQKCSPEVIPFAGFIQEHPGESNVAFTARNFTFCVNSMLRSIADAAMEPFYFIIRVINENFGEILKTMMAVRVMFNRIRQSVRDIAQNLSNRIMEMLLSIMKMALSLQSVMEKVVGVFTTCLYSLIGSYATMRSLFGIIMRVVIIVILGALVGIIIGYIIISMIPIFGSWAIPLVVANTALMLSIVAVAATIKIFMDRVMHEGTAKIPSVPRCFAEATPVEVSADDGVHWKTKAIKDIIPGDILRYGGQVTGVLVLDGRDQHMYDIDGVVVSGDHYIIEEHAMGTKWRKVKEVPRAKPLGVLNLAKLYNLLTADKYIGINNLRFADWDDMSPEVVAKLKAHPVSSEVLPRNFEQHPLTVHAHLASGLVETTAVVMANGQRTPLCDVQLGDQLAGGGKVLGVVQILAHNALHHREYRLASGDRVQGTANLVTLGLGVGGGGEDEEVALIADATDIAFTMPQYNNVDHFYHLLTSTGTFMVQRDTVLRDYNAGLDHFLSD